MQSVRCYEFLLLKKLQEDGELWENLKEKMRRDGIESFTAAETPTSLWYLSITLHETKEKFARFVCDQVRLEKERNPDDVVGPRTDSLLGAYLNCETLVELRLDSVFKYGEDAVLPREIFTCPNVRLLSLKCNYLEQLPVDVGRLSRLESLALTNNKLQNGSIPYSLTFCRRLRVLLLDNNLLDALPGFLLRMNNLRTVHRHGNHNYFKATFMWYHTDVNDRVLRVDGCGGGANTAVGGCATPLMGRGAESLQFLAARAVVAAKFNFFAGKSLPKALEDYVADLYSEFNVCGHETCQTAHHRNRSGYKVYTFKNPYLGNTCVPFQHWACSAECAAAIEVPARLEQVKASVEQDRAYASYVREVQRRNGDVTGHPRTDPPPEFPLVPSCVLL